MKNRIKITTLAFLATLMVSNLTEAKDYNWIIRGRALYVKADEKSSVSGLGGHVAARPTQVPELDFTYFFNKNVAAELILATTTHDINLRGSALGANSKIGTVNLLPPTLTLQYHIAPESTIRPYVGAGLNYTFFYNSKAEGAATTIKYNDNVGYALQAGFDYMINERFGVNFDVKKIYLSTKAQVNGSYTAKVRLDPWLLGVGMSYRF